MSDISLPPPITVKAPEANVVLLVFISVENAASEGQNTPPLQLHRTDCHSWIAGSGGGILNDLLL